MKKNYLLYFVVILVVVLSCGLTACNNADHNLENYISYEQTSSLIGENPTYSVIIEKGSKEEIFVPDGKINKKVPFTIIKIFDKFTDEKNNVVTYELVTDNGTKKGEINKDKFKKHYEKTIHESQNIKSIKITKGGKTEEIKLENQLKDKLSSKDALKIAEKELAVAIEEGWKEDKFDKEIYIRYIRYNNDIKSPSYWYIAVIDTNNSFSAVLIDPKTGEIITTKK